jgi:xanthine dehydrogenase accessory factor
MVSGFVFEITQKIFSLKLISKHTIRQSENYHLNLNLNIFVEILKEMRNIYIKLAEYAGTVPDLVLATVISTSGSTPVKAGSSALFDRTGLVYGTVGGGILEGRVTELAMKYAGTGRAGIHHFELDKDISKKNEAICGGRASVMIDAGVIKHHAVFEKISELESKRIFTVLATELTERKGEVIAINRFLLSEPGKGQEKNGFSDALKDEVTRLMSSEGTEQFAIAEMKNTEGEVRHVAFIEPVFPRKHLIIAGAGHIGKVLCHFASLLDFDVTVIDDRAEFAGMKNLPDADNIICGDIGTELMKIEKGCDTFIVIVTRGHNDDSNALRACIDSPTAYTGMIGSKTKIEKMRRNFLDKGWATIEKWESVHTPIGIDIGSKNVEEIALSIAAELVMVRNSQK